MIIEEAKISSSDSQLEVVGDYILKLKVGEGPLSTLWKASSMVTQEEVALKQVFLSKLNPTLKNCLDCELNFLSSVRHPNIICLLHVIKHHGRVQGKTARRFLQQLGAGLENILLSCLDGDAVLKIADFGLLRTVQPSDHAGTVYGSPLYMAPEVDLCSLGAILIELLNGYPPFHGRTNAQNIKSSKSLPFSEIILHGLDAECVDMCSRLLMRDPGSRLSLQLSRLTKPCGVDCLSKAIKLNWFPVYELVPNLKIFGLKLFLCARILLPIAQSA
ncbi:Protein kinase domain [Dillenia turbinata]|uniref:Protein kinase domain n=1 Tax=Dillenia turbinata TaxID=194707 RepID=A0AAN8UVM0_9MAGN